MRKLKYIHGSRRAELIAALTVIIYLMLAVGNADWHPANWDPAFRGLAAFLWAVGVVVFLMVPKALLGGTIEEVRWIPVSEGPPKRPAGYKRYKIECWIIRNGRRQLAQWDFTYECWCFINKIGVDDMAIDREELEQKLNYVQYYLPVDIPPVSCGYENKRLFACTGGRQT